MLKSQEITLAQSKRREKMAAIQAVSEITDAARDELRSLTDGYSNAEVELRAALLVEGAERATIKGTDKAQSDFALECRSFSLSGLVGAMTEGKPLSGREAEVVAELETRGQTPQRGGVVIPWEAFALETRADAVTDTAPGTTGELQARPVMNALERFFENSAAQRFGVRALQVQGTPSFPEITGGGGLSWVAEGDGADSAAITTTATSPAIHTATARYVMTRQATRQNPALEAILRRDLSEIMRQGIDLAVFRGTGVGEEPAGLGAVLTGGRTAALTGKASFSAFLQRAVELQETAKLSDAGGIRIAGAPVVAQTLADSLIAGTAVSELDRLKAFGFAPLWSSQVSARGARDGTGKGASTVFFAAGDGHALMPTWGGVEVIIDPYSESKSGKVAITTFAFLDLLFQRTSTHFFKLTAVQDRA